MGQVTVSVIWLFIVVVLVSKPGKTDEVSKACYGAQGQPCTRHSLRCSSGLIRIQETFYLYSTVCGVAGVATCNNINISNQSLTDTTQTVATMTSTNSMLTARPDSNEASSPKQTSENNNGLAGGMFAAGFFTGLGVAAVISGLVYFLYIRRRCEIKKPEPGPESLPPPAYTGLADLGPPDTYDVIDRPEEVTTSEPRHAPVYQNVDDAS